LNLADTRTVSPAAVELSLVTGAGITANGVVEVRNPANTSEVVGTIPRISPSDIDAIAQCAAKVQPVWGARSAAERHGILSNALAGIETDGLNELLTREHGKVLADSTRELQYLSFPVRYLAEHVEWLDKGDDYGDNGMHHTRVYRDPVGVVGLLTPWNVPIGMSVITLAPALLAGNAVLVHVPVTAPLTALHVWGALARALPPGLLNIVSSPDTAVAQAIVEHPLVRAVHFTGSTAIGSLVAQEAAPSMATALLELGGNDPGIVFDDMFDDETMFARLLASAFGFAGQACVALKRLYVPRHRVGDVVDGMGALLAPTVVGNGLDPKVTMGPLHTAAGKARIERMVAGARADGARVHEYGTLAADPTNGHFLLPTLVTGATNGNAIVDDEQFGPTLPIIAYDSLDEAIAMANDSQVGLGSSVWTRDLDRALAVSRRIEAGMTWINIHGGAGIDGRAPWGGVKESGIGRGGANRAGLEAFTEAHSVTMPSAAGR
jgi:acyl-CoA reductase-like NAD-dependent aldehyde dehydrogenase